LSDPPGQDEVVVQKRARNSLRNRVHLGLSNEGERVHARRGALTLHSAVAHHRSLARAAGGGADFKNVLVCLIKPPSNAWSAGRCRCTQCTSMEHCLNRPRPLHLFNDRDWSILPGVQRDQPSVFSFPQELRWMRRGVADYKAAGF
jgi:hypothetical protein